ncbi:MAG TPA: alpha/beta hydrolase [Novosphingobium sp.]|nr:alpha/beta hydrolase [Novosphingobium sp.]
MTDASQHDRARPLILTVPGLNSSGPAHWQSLWEKSREDCVRAELGTWSRPHRNTWVAKLSHAITAARRPVILCAHSLGCLAVAWWSLLEGQGRDGPVAGALLVAPPDCDRRRLPEPLVQFQPVPRTALPFPSIVAASRNDPYAEIGFARELAAQWGSSFVDVGMLGHINAASDIGDWPFGEGLLDLLAAEAGTGKGVGRVDRAQLEPVRPFNRPSTDNGAETGTRAR